MRLCWEDSCYLIIMNINMALITIHIINVTKNTYNCFGSLLIFRIFEKLLKFLLIYSKIASLSKYICVITRDHINDDICYYGNLQWNYAIWVLFLYLNVWIKRELSKFCQLKIFWYISFFVYIFWKISSFEIQFYTEQYRYILHISKIRVRFDRAF